MKKNLIITIKNFIKRNDTKILTGIAITGAIAAPILASRATLKAKEKIDRIEESRKRIEQTYDAFGVEPVLRKETKMTLLSKARYTAHLYIPTVAVVGISIYSMIKCEKIHVTRELEILGISAFWENRYRLLNDKLIEKMGPEGVAELKKEIATEQRTLMEEAARTGQTSIKGEDGKEKKFAVTRNDRFLLYDPICGDYNYASLNDLAAACCVLNRRFMGMGYYGNVTWNEIRRVLGWPLHPEGKTHGWNGDTDEDLIEMMQYNGDNWIDIFVGTSEGVDPYLNEDGELEIARALYFNYAPSAL